MQLFRLKHLSHDPAVCQAYLNDPLVKTLGSLRLLNDILVWVRHPGHQLFSLSLSHLFQGQAFLDEDGGRKASGECEAMLTHFRTVTPSHLPGDKDDIRIVVIRRKPHFLLQVTSHIASTELFNKPPSQDRTVLQEQFFDSYCNTRRLSRTTQRTSTPWLAYNKDTRPIVINPTRRTRRRLQIPLRGPCSKSSNCRSSQGPSYRRICVAGASILQGKRDG
jgi:hypothetical protein